MHKYHTMQSYTEQIIRYKQAVLENAKNIDEYTQKMDEYAQKIKCLREETERFKKLLEKHELENKYILDRKIDITNSIITKEYSIEYLKSKNHVFTMLCTRYCTDCMKNRNGDCKGKNCKSMFEKETIIPPEELVLYLDRATFESNVEYPKTDIYSVNEITYNCCLYLGRNHGEMEQFQFCYRFKVSISCV